MRIHQKIWFASEPAEQSDVIPSVARDLLVKPPKRYYVYILASRSRTLYTGITGNLRRRVADHRQGDMPGFTQQYRIHRLVYFEFYQDVRMAIAREKEIKGWRRSKKVALIEGSNPTWEDLAVDWFLPIETRTAGPSLRSG